MTDKWAEHKQKFCGCKDASRSNACKGLPNCELPDGHAERKCAAPRQPEGEGLEGEGLEVVAWQDAENPLYTTAERRVLHDWANNGYPIVELCRLSDAQRVIAELRDRLDVMTQCADTYSLMFEESAEECEHLKACQENAMLHMTGLVAERNTLRQQLAEQDAEIERLRVKLMTIASAEPGRHNIEWAKAMAATGNNEAYAKWREAFDQRDKLAGLLRRSAPHVMASAGASHMMEGFKPRRNKLDELSDEIDAALAEVKP